MADETYDIQKLVQESGVPRRTIYFYVQQGILPPPEGAGLAAYYTREHLLRLRLIPVLRGQGLRLDDIRARLAGMSAAEMERLLAQAEAQPLIRAVPVPAAEPPSAPPGWQGRAMRLYTLPGDITLLVPADRTPENDPRLRRLLEAAAEIYQVSGVARPDNGKIHTEIDSTQEA